jgi:hypothetical protein
MASIADIREHQKPVPPIEIWAVITKEGVNFAAEWPEACHEHINDNAGQDDYYNGAIVRKYRLVKNEKAD